MHPMHPDALGVAELRKALEQIRGHLGACIVQRIPSDDAIIFEHIEAAYKLTEQDIS